LNPFDIFLALEINKFLVMNMQKHPRKLTPTTV
jgi:hypothetical protein